MPIGRDRAQHDVAVDLGRVDVNAIQIIARLFRRDRELRLVDQLLQVTCRQRETVRQIAGVEVGEIAFGQGLQVEARAARAQQEPSSLSRHLQRDLRAIGQLADDVIQNMGWQRCRARLTDIGGEAFRDFKIKIGGPELEVSIGGLQQDIGQDRDGVAPFDDAVHMAQRLEKRRSFESDFHGP